MNKMAFYSLKGIDSSDPYNTSRPVYVQAGTFFISKSCTLSFY